MFIENRIKFGYGTVAVGANRMLRMLTLEYIEPPVTVGTQITPEELEACTSHGKLQFGYKEDMRTLLADLKTVSVDNPILEFRGYIFDFTHFNPESVKTVESMLVKAIMGDPLTWAC